MYYGVCVYVGMEVAQSGSGDHVVAITPTVTNTTDLTQVLSGLQNSGELSSVLQQQPHLVEGTSTSIRSKLCSPGTLCMVYF